MSSIMNGLLYGKNGAPARLVFHKHDGSTVNFTNEKNAWVNEKNAWEYKNEKNAWVSIDLGEGRSLVVNYYSLRHGDSGGLSRLQSWDFEGSNDTVLRVHTNDDSLPNEAFSVAAWEVEGANQAYRHFRIRMTGENSTGGHGLCCAGIELWGRLLSR
jgi:hypothetical protein